MKSESFKADAVLLFITAIWGATFVVVKDALDLADPYTFLALRFTVGTLGVGVFALRELRDPRVWKRGAILGVLLFGGYAFQTVGLKYTSPSRSAFITGLIVIFVPFVSWALFKRRPAGAALVGSVIALVGMAVLTDLSLDSGLPLGDLLTLGCAIVYSVQIALTETMSRDVSARGLVTVQLGVTAVMSWGAKGVTESHATHTWPLWGAILATGLLASAFAITAQAWAQARTSATHAGLIFTLEPVFAALTSTVLGREVLTAHEWIGGTMILFGVLLGEVGPLVMNRGERS